jgi:hypothetical protein
MEPIEAVRERIKGKRVIYIYHNKIDDTGDKNPSEHEVFNAVDSTIQDITKMINRLGRSLNVTKVIIGRGHNIAYIKRLNTSFTSLIYNRTSNSFTPSPILYS